MQTIRPAHNVALRALHATGWMLIVLIPAGCGNWQRSAKPVDPDEARQTLGAVLADWAQGGTPEAWLEQSPQVVIQDLDWSGGAKLKAFEVLGTGEPRDANLFCQVKLVLEDASRQQVERTVTYCIGTDPVLTVFRAMNP
ncbi:MAG: hypothetical protein ACYC0X_00580 [Pirellulaceae bacterium]